MISLNEINPYIRVAMNCVLGPYHHIRRRVLFDYELIYIERGSFILKYDDKSYEVKEGSFILLRPGVSNSFRGIGVELSQPHIHFDIKYDNDSSDIGVSFKDIDAFSKKEKSMIREDIFYEYEKNPYVVFEDKNAALSLFWSVILSGKNGGQLTRKAKMIQLIEMIISDNYPKLFDQTSMTEYSVSKQIKDYFDAQQGIKSDLDELAAQFSYSKYYLERQFQKEYGISLISYRNKVRMRVARELLAENTVTEVSNMLGYSSVFSFSREYKDHYGVAPSEDKGKIEKKQ